MIQAFSSNWTRPYAMSHPGQPYEIPDFELLTTVLSALMWRKNNGSIRMITDCVGERYYRSLGLDSLWDGGISCELDAIPYTIDPSTYWAVGKLYALQHISAPCVMMDTDFIVWCKLEERLASSDLAVIHREDLMPDIYPDREVFSLARGYSFPENWDWETPACNTALTWFGSEELRQEYITQALKFVRATRGHDSLIYMVFAEQRLLAMCAQANGYQIDALSTPEELFQPDQKEFTHTWGFKQAMMEHPEMREAFCARCAARITRDFPEYRDICAGIPSLRKYF